MLALLETRPSVKMQVTNKATCTYSYSESDQFLKMESNIQRSLRSSGIELGRLGFRIFLFGKSTKQSCDTETPRNSSFAPYTTKEKKKIIICLS